MSNSAIWLLMLLALSSIFGLYRKRTDGRIKLSRTIDNKKQDQTSNQTPEAYEVRTSVTNEIQVVGTAEVTTQEVPTQEIPTPAAPTHGLPNGTPELKFGQLLGTEVTLVQFSSAFCQPCRATRLLLEDVAASTPGVVHIEIDAEAHLDLVREMGVTRTPTTFILNRKGDVVGKSVGLPKRHEVMNVVEAVTAST
jgi:thiol-disulfide isomerase/thioredoxin